MPLPVSAKCSLATLATGLVLLCAQHGDASYLANYCADKRGRIGRVFLGIWPSFAGGGNQRSQARLV